MILSDQINFYGYGNDTKLQTDDRSYNRARIKQFISSTGLFRNFGNQMIQFGGVVENMKVEGNEGRFIKQPFADVDNIIFKSNTFLGAYIKYNIGKKNSEKYPSKGYNFQTDVTYKSNVTTGNKDFVNISSAFSFYIPLGKLVLAHRTGGAINFGKFEFYHVNTLGESDNLRGYFRTRVTGKNAFYQNTELRLPVANLKSYVLRGKLGIYGFFDDGRVWVKDDNSDKIHTAFGPGIFFVPYGAATLNISYGISS